LEIVSMRPYTYATGPDTRIKFPAKPDERVRSCLKAHGFQWSPSMGCWWKRGYIGLADVVKALDRLLMPRRPDGACWRCHSPNGYFRNRGAATPVWCDRCHVEITAAESPGRFDFEDAAKCWAECGL
jgi:hypothetical protein